MAFHTKREITAICPGCGNEIYFHQKPKLGQFVTCPECGDMTEVISLEPIALDWSADWEDDVWEDESDFDGSDYDDDIAFDDDDDDDNDFDDDDY